MKDPIIEFKNVSKRFGDKVVLDKASFSLYSGEVTTLIGKSGVGKSVTLKLIIGLLKPDAGEIYYQGKPISTMARREKKDLRRSVNFMFQNNALFDSMNVYQNLSLPLEETFRMNKQDIHARVMSILEEFDLKGIESNYPSQLSGGMQKRVAMARALITEPSMVLFDEPTTGLDPVRKKNVLKMITFIQKNYGFTAVLVSHDVPDIFYISNRIVIIEKGRIIFEGTPMELEQSEELVVHEFINSMETLKNEIISIKTRRDLEKTYREERKADLLKEPFMVLLFNVNPFERVQERVGHLLAQNIISTLAELINKYTDIEGYFCGRYSRDRILCILPRTGPDKAGHIRDNIAVELKNKDFMHESTYTATCVDFSIELGMAQGSNTKELRELVDMAQNATEPMAELSCGMKNGLRSL